MNSAEPYAIALMGPTASGKTDLAIELSERLNGEIVSVDSALIYRGMDIGTAKPDRETLQRYPHHLVDICDPAESYSAGQFCKDALNVIESILAKGKVPILVGGTMMYFKSLLRGIAVLPQADENIRAQILAEAAQEGWLKLHQQLQQIDAASAAKINPNDQQRIQRALEVFHLTGKPLSQLLAEQAAVSLPCQFHSFALMTDDRAWLHQRIALRFDLMLKQGFEQEVRALYQRGDLHADMPSIRCVGYRQMWGYLDGEYGFDEMRDKGIAATRQLAKRQITWLRSWPDLNLVDAKQKQMADFIVKKI